MTSFNLQINNLTCNIFHTNSFSFSFVCIEKIRVGKDYQAVCPEMLLGTETIIDKALLVWSPTKDIPEIKRKIQNNLTQLSSCVTYSVFVLLQLKNI